MAIIKCPECGHQVSEKAPICPSCGVEIAGKITRCSVCGEVFFNDQTICPACHTTVADSVVPVVRPTSTVKVEETGSADNSGETPKKPKKSYWPLICGFIFAVIVVGVLWYFNYQSKIDKEAEHAAYVEAMASSDVVKLESYLLTYKDSDPSHRDSIQTRLSILRQIDEDWANAVVSGTKDELERYLRQHPESEHKADALNKIDSIDYTVADKDRSLEAYQEYLRQHPDGKYAEKASLAIKEINAKRVTPEEVQTVKGIFRKFFQSVNSRNEDGLLATVAEPMISLLGKTGALRGDVLTFMNRLYKDNISNMNWHITDDFKIDKQTLADGTCEYGVEFIAEQHKDFRDGTHEITRYRITGNVDAEGKISKMLMTKLAD